VTAPSASPQPWLTDDVLRLIEALKWPAVALVAVIAIALLFRREIRGLLHGVRARAIKVGSTELAPEQIPPPERPAAPVAVTPTPGAAAGIPHIFELNDSAFVTNVIDEMTKNLANLRFDSPATRERWMVREGAALVIMLDYERLYRVIWQSQMNLLWVANITTGTDVKRAKEFYDKGAANAPTVYADYSFDQWLGFVVDATGLLTKDAEGRLKTSEKGQLFLEYLVKQKYDPRGINRGA
jgi:hypothetical protein